MSRNEGSAALANDNALPPAESYQQQADARTAYGQAAPGNRHLTGPTPGPPTNNVPPITTSGTSFAAAGATMNSGRPSLGSGPPPSLHNNGPPMTGSVPLLNSNPQFNNGLPQTGSGPPKSGSTFNSGSSLTSPTQLNNGPLLTSRSPTNSEPSLINRSPSSSLFNNGPPVNSGLLNNSRLPPTSTLSNSGSLLNSGPSYTAGTLSNSGQTASGPAVTGALSQSSSAPPSSRPPMSSGHPSGAAYTNGPPLSGNLLKNSGAPLTSGSPYTSNVPPTTRPFNNDPSPITGPLTNIGSAHPTGLPPSSRPPLNNDPSQMAKPQSNVSYNSGLPPTNRSGLSNDQITGPASSIGSVHTSNMPPTSRHPLNTNPQQWSQQIPGVPFNSGPAMNSNLPPGAGLTNIRPPMNSGPPLNTRPQLNSGPPMNNGPPLNNSGPAYLSGPPISSAAPTQTSSTGPALNSIPTLQRVDQTQGLSQQFQNVNLSGPSSPYGYKTDAPPNQMPQMGTQAYSATNRPLDMRSPTYPNPYNQPMNQPQSLNVTKSGFNKIWGMESVDIFQCRNVLPGEKVEPPRIKLQQDLLDRVNCSPDIFRCTLTKIPESNSLLQKARLPLGILIHPFKDLNHLPVIQCSTIVRCRSCRTYINPFVFFVDSKRWKCNLCYKVNELPDEFQFDPATKSYGDPSRRPEIRTSTIEFIAPSEYMLRPPQPSVYLFIFDVSRLAVESGYLAIVCGIIAEEMSRLPGDGRTQIGFIAVDSAVHYFCMPENVSQPHHMIMMDVEDVFLPCPENLLVNLKEREELLKSLLTQLPHMFKDSFDTGCALGAALQVAYKLTSPTGGRVSVFQTCLPNVGPGALQPREDPSARAGKDVAHLNPATDFYKRLALDCSGQQVAVDLFLLNCQYSDLASLSGVCKFSGGCIYNIPLFQASRSAQAETLERLLRRYLTRKIGFEAVMRIRCTRGLGIHTFHGNFFVRSTDLLSLPNVNPDAGFGMQVTIDESLSDAPTVCFQAALLYTSSRGERRIRVHTLCLPTTANLAEVLYSADQQCIVGLLAKMAVDRSVQSSLSDAREALINAVVDSLSAYKLLQAYPGAGLLAPNNLKLLPMYINALLKCRAFRFGVSTRLDDRFYAMCQLKTLPLSQLIQFIYPDLYAVHEYVQHPVSESEDGQVSPQPERLHLSAEKLDSHGAFLLDNCDQILLYVGKNIHPSFCYNVLGVPSFAAIPEEMWGLPELATPESERLRLFVTALQDDKPYYATVQIIRDDGHFRTQFTERLIEDRFENALSYYEFLQHIKTQVK